MSNRITSQQWEQLKKDRPGLVYKEIAPPVKNKKHAFGENAKACFLPDAKIPRNTPVGLLYIKNMLKYNKIPFTEEYQFDIEKKRKFRFDIAIPERKIAIEYEGIFSEKSRHTNAQGYSTDAEKYTLAAMQGWEVWRYTAMNYKNFNQDIMILVS